MTNSLSQRVCFYIDGFNFYYGLKEKDWGEFYWLDIVKFCRSLIKSYHTLISVNYYSAPPINHSGKKRRQRKFFDANELNNLFKLHLSIHKPKNKICDNCGYTIYYSEEKQTDVRIAVDMLKNCANDVCDLTVLISGDTDLIPSLEAIKEIYPNHKILIFFPPARKTHDMINYADGWRDLGLDPFRRKFINSIFDDDVISDEGTIITIPAKWKGFQLPLIS